MDTTEFESLLLHMHWELKYGDRAAYYWYKDMALQEAMNLLAVAAPTEEQIDKARENN